METTSRTPGTVAVREDVAADLGDTVDTSTRTDGKATGTVRRAASSVRETGRKQATRVQESVRQRPGRWAGAGTGVVAVAAAVAGALMWQRNRRKPVGRGARVWNAVSSRFSR
jgi:hypothetical protein